MGGGLHGRLILLERVARAEAGCQVCHGCPIAGWDEEKRMPGWVNERGQCRGCGQYVKAYPQELLDRLV
jgi:hypothetical protein